MAKQDFVLRFDLKVANVVGGEFVHRAMACLKVEKRVKLMKISKL